MELRELIELATTKFEKQTELAKAIGVHTEALTAAKAGKRGLPTVACGKLADVLGTNPWTVKAASELVTEKDEEKRAYLAPFVRKAASWILATTALASIAIQSPESRAATGSMTQGCHNNWHYVNSIRRLLRRKVFALFARFPVFLTVAATQVFSYNRRPMPRRPLPYPLPRPRDLFGEVPVYESDLQLWVRVVAPHISHAEWRIAAYIKGYNVVEKVRRAKLNGDWTTIEEHRAPM